METRGPVLTCVDHLVTLQGECPVVDKEVASVCTMVGISPVLENSEGRRPSRPKRLTLSRLAKFISGSFQIKKKGKHVSRRSAFLQSNVAFEGEYFKDVNSPRPKVNPPLLQRASNFLSRRRSGNDVVFGRNSRRTVEMNMSAAQHNRAELTDADNCVSPSKCRRMSLPVGYTSVLRDDNGGDRRMSLPVGYTSVLHDDNLGDRRQHSFTLDTTGDLSQDKEINQSRVYRRSLSRRRFTSLTNFSPVPRSFRGSFTHRQEEASSKHLHSQTLNSSNLGQRQLFMSSKQSCNRTFESSNRCDQRMSESHHHLKQTVDSCNNCNKQSFNSAKPVGGDRNMAETEPMAAGGVQNIDTGSHNQEHVGQTGRVARWAVYFDQLLQDPLGIDTFTKFLEKVFSDENIRFWQVCQHFRGLTDPQQQQTTAKDIYNRHLAVRASDPVNVDNAARSHTEQFLDNPTSAMFDVAQNQIQRLMKQDSYPRFLKSDMYKNMVVEEMEGKIHHEPEKISENKSDKKENAGKQNGAKRRRSLLPWKRFL